MASNQVLGRALVADPGAPASDAGGQRARRRRHGRRRPGRLRSRTRQPDHHRPRAAGHHPAALNPVGLGTATAPAPQDRQKTRRRSQ